MAIDQLQHQVEELSDEELKVFIAWFENYQADQWDRQIEADALNGNIDRMIKKLAINLDEDSTEPLTAGLSRVSERVRQG